MDFCYGYCNVRNDGKERDDYERRRRGFRIVTLRCIVRFIRLTSPRNYNRNQRGFSSILAFFSVMSQPADGPEIVTIPRVDREQQ